MQRADIDDLAKLLSLSQYQYDVLKSNYKKYDISGLVKRGGVLYAPYLLKTDSLSSLIRTVLYGKHADLIGQNKMLASGKKKIKFYAGGFHCVCLGRFKYYADKNGRVVSRNKVMREISNLKR